LVYDAMVIGLQSDANALSSHTKNNCLLMVLLSAFRISGKRSAEYRQKSVAVQQLF
jgi:hypothetical protein